MILIHDPGVALTDYVLAIEGIILAWASLRTRANNSGLLKLITAFFMSLAASSFLGGSYHGFFPDKTSTPLGWTVWIATMLSIGITAVLIWLLVWKLSGTRGSIEIFSLLPLLGLAIFGSYVIFIDHRFLLAIYFYTPAVLVLLLMLIWLYIRNHSWQLLTGIIGIAITFVAAYVQQAGSNTLYHILQGLGVALLFVAFRYLLINHTYDPR